MPKFKKGDRVVQTHNDDIETRRNGSPHVFVIIDPTPDVDPSGRLWMHARSEEDPDFKPFIRPSYWSLVDEESLS